MEEKNLHTEPKQHHHKGSQYLFIIFVGVVFVALTIVFLFFPRSKYSELEKRDLATFPPIENLWDNPSKYTADVSSWFSDSEPYRDKFMAMSMGIRNGIKFYPFGEAEEVVSFKPTDDNAQGDVFNPGNLDAQGNPLADEDAKVANKGILVIGKEPNVRAISAFGGYPGLENQYLETLKAYADALPGVQIYAMAIPNASEFYIPTKAQKSSKPQLPVLHHIRDNVDKRVKFVDVHKFLAAHTKEDIFLRTDHHWAPLGAYYGAQALAVAAGVPFKTLESYDKKIVRDFVGSMYGYSKDIAVKNSPEDFIYYVPRDVNTEASFITYKIDKDYHVTSETGPYKSNFFKQYKDGSGGAYSTFMGGDTHTVKIVTGTPGTRKLLVIKDSYGNPVPSFLFYSFAEIHVVDFRYFPKNIKQYVKDNGITDLSLTFSIFNTCNSSSMTKVKNFLTQAGGIQPSKASETTQTSATKSEKKDAPNQAPAKPKEEKKAAPVKEEKKKAAEAPAKPKSSESKESGSAPAPKAEAPAPQEPAPASEN